MNLFKKNINFFEDNKHAASIGSSHFVELLLKVYLALLLTSEVIRIYIYLRVQQTLMGKWNPMSSKLQFCLLKL